MRKMLLAAVALSIFVTCADIPLNEPVLSDSVPEDLGISFTLSRLNDEINAYCFYPIELRVDVNRNNVRYVDSMFLMTSDNMRESVYKLDLSALTQTFAYADTGSHTVTLRVYEARYEGDFYDSVFTVRTAINYGAGPIEARVGKSGTRVGLRANGHKHDDAEWYWDLSGIGEGIIRAAGDTAISIGREVSGTVSLSQINSANARSAPVPVQFNATLPRLSPVQYTVSQVNSSFNAYALFPITFTAHPRQADRDFIDSIQLFTGNNPMDAPLKLGPSNNYKAVFDFADTGSYTCRMRVFDGTGAEDAPAYRDTVFTLSVGADFGIDGVASYPVSDTGGIITLRAIGNKYSQVFWEWDLSRFKGGLVRSLSDTLSIHLNRPDNSDTIYLYQTKLENVNGTLTARSTARYAYALKTHLATYIVTIKNAQDGDVVVGVRGPNSHIPVRSVEVISGHDITLDYSHGDACVWSEWNGSFYKTDVCKLEKILINGKPAAKPNEGILLKAVREDTEVAYYLNADPRSRIWWPNYTYFDYDQALTCDKYFGVALYELNKDMRSGRIVFEGYTNGDSPNDTRMLDTFNLSKEQLTKGGHIVKYDEREYGLWGVRVNPPYGAKRLRIEFEDNRGQKHQVWGNTFALGYPSRPYYGGPTGSWVATDEEYRNNIDFRCENLHYDIYYTALPYEVRGLFADWRGKWRPGNI